MTPFHTRLTYHDRESRAQYIADKYRSILIDSVLDVGCGEGYLRRYLPDHVQYWGIDIVDTVDEWVDLEHGLPYPDGEFDVLVCADVLEHVDNLHGLFDDLCRVARCHVIISLPNSWGAVVRNTLRQLFHLGGYRVGKGLKKYGLPLEPPDDRHRWLFALPEAADFVRQRAARNGMEVVQMDVYHTAAARWLTRLGRWLMRLVGGDAFADALWVVLEKRR